jgi:predicted transcriptional regulator
MSSNVSDITEDLGATEAGVSRILEDVQRANLVMQDVLETLDEVKSTLSQVNEQGRKCCSCPAEEVRGHLNVEAESDKLFMQESLQEIQTLSR